MYNLCIPSLICCKYSSCVVICHHPPNTTTPRAATPQPLNCLRSTSFQCHRSAKKAYKSPRNAISPLNAVRTSFARNDVVARSVSFGAGTLVGGLLCVVLLLRLGILIRFFVWMSWLPHYLEFGAFA